MFWSRHLYWELNVTPPVRCCKLRIWVLFCLEENASVSNTFPIYGYTITHNLCQEQGSCAILNFFPGGEPCRVERGRPATTSTDGGGGWVLAPSRGAADSGCGRAALAPSLPAGSARQVFAARAPPVPRASPARRTAGSERGRYSARVRPVWRRCWCGSVGSERGRRTQ